MKGINYFILAVLLLLPLGGIYQLLRSPASVQISLEALLPQHTNQLKDELSRLLKQKVLIATKQDGSKLHEQLKQIPGLTLNEYQPLEEFTFLHRYQLLNCSYCRNNLTDTITSALYNPFASITDLELSHDPFLVMRHLMEQPQIPAKISYDPPFCLRGTINREQYCLITATFDYEHFSSQDLLNSLQQIRLTDPSLLYTADALFAASASRNAQNDMMRIGIISTIGCVILFILTFHSIRILLFTVLTLGIALLEGIAAVLMLFGSIHAITLALGACLIGICIDYNLHTFMTLSDEKSSKAAVLKLKAPLLLSLLSSVAAYLVMALTDLLVLRQLSVMAVVTLTTTYLLMLYLLPHLPIPKVAPNPLVALMLKGAGNIAVLWKTALWGIIILAGIWCWLSHPADDDVARMQQVDAQLSQHNQLLEQALHDHRSSVWFQLPASSLQMALEQCEQIRDSLSKDQLRHLLLPCSIIPSNRQQSANIKIYQQSLPQLQKIYQQFGVDISPPDLDNQTVFAPREHPLYNLLPITDHGLLIRVDGSADDLIARLNQFPELLQIRQRQLWSQAFGKYRTQLSILLCSGFIIIALMLYARWGRQTLRIFVLPALCALCGGTLANVLWTQGYMNLFTVMAGFMILGLGTDYCVFYHLSSEQEKSRTLHTLLIAWLTTEISFGMLALSDTAVIASFGLNLAVGLALMLSGVIIWSDGSNNLIRGGNDISK